MSGPDSGLDALKEISHTFSKFREGRGKVSEADTRVKIIDRILTEVLNWSEEFLSREEHVDSGYIDYTLLVQSRPYVAVEAKREGVAFELPVRAAQHTNNLRIDSSLSTDAEIKAAIAQVRGYCDDAGIRYAIATNGYAWIVFRAIREDKPWRQGLARVFSSLEEIQEHFTEFWNLLSYPAIVKGSLDAHFGAPNRTPRRLLRVVDNLFNADLPLQRNRLHAQLHPLIVTIFENIADQDAIEVLQSCYVHSKSLRIVAEDLNIIITDSIPQFLLDQGARPAKQTDTDAGRFGIVLAEAMPTRQGQLFLLLGGIGSGKTTFIKRYQRTVGMPLLNEKALWFHVDFLEAPDLAEMETFVWTTILAQLRARYVSPHLETRKNIKKAFADKIGAIEHTALRGLRTWNDQYEKAISSYLARWQEDTREYVPRLLKVGRQERGVEIVIFIDNVDQMSPVYQSQIFLLAQRITRAVGSITVVSLREESYYTANLQKTLTAYTNRKFHVASPHFRRLIGSRIRFALDSLDANGQLRQIVIPDGIDFDERSVSEFLRIVEYSIFEQNRNIARFIESLCFGNMRMALEMFTTFLVSGATDVDKMLAIHRRDGAYFVAFHEFVKSIMLGDRKYYKESFSPVLNLFDCGTERNSSHFTSIRILLFLLSRRGESSKEGQGYFEISRLVALMEDVFDNREDTIRALNRLVHRQLAEVNTRSTESIEGASHTRVTSSGWYYSRFLSGLFSYLDLVLQDTPLDDEAIHEYLRKSVARVDNLADREDEKLQRMQVRFDRVAAFLTYLSEQEDKEHAGRDLAAVGGVVGERIVPGLMAGFEKERAWIETRLRKNREREREDVEIVTRADEAEEQLEQAALFDPDEPETEPPAAEARRE